MVNSTYLFSDHVSKSTTVEIYMVNSTLSLLGGWSDIYNSRNLYGQFDRRHDMTDNISTTVEIYMVNST